MYKYTPEPKLLKTRNGMWQVIEHVYGIEEEWEQSFGTFESEEEAWIVAGQLEISGRHVFVRSEE